MTAVEQVLTHLISMGIISVMLVVCLRSPAGGESVAGRRVYRIHSGWYIFCGVGGTFLSGIFAYATFYSARPEDRTMTAILSAVSAVAFLFTALALRAASITADEEGLIVSSLWTERSVAWTEIQSIQVIGLSVVLGLHPRPEKKKRRRFTFFSGFRGLGELVAIIRARAKIG